MLLCNAGFTTDVENMKKVRTVPKFHFTKLHMGVNPLDPIGILSLSSIKDSLLRRNLRLALSKDDAADSGTRLACHQILSHSICL